MRAAIYFAPAADARISGIAALWLGRDAFTGMATRPADPAVDPLVAEPARYGFHATMKAPFHLMDGMGIDDLDAGLAAFCAGRQAVRIERLVLRRLGGFLALVPERQSAALTVLAADVVATFERFRAPLDTAAIARRRPEALGERQRAYLHEWGYPYVFDEFRFHMTLTGRLEEPVASRTEAELGERFATVTDRPLDVDGLALFVEREAGAPFEIRSRHSFGTS